MCVVRRRCRCQHRGSRRTPCPKRFASRLRSDDGLTARNRGGVIQTLFGCLPTRRATVTTANDMIDQLTEHDRTELLARAQDAWERAPQNTMRAVFEWRGKNYVVSHSSVQLRVHTEEGIKVY